MDSLKKQEQELDNISARLGKDLKPIDASELLGIKVVAEETLIRSISDDSQGKKAIETCEKLMDRCPDFNFGWLEGLVKLYKRLNR